MQIKKIIALDNPFRLYYHELRWMLANLIHKNPSRDMIVIGVTGTNGKTTTTNLIASGLKSAWKKVFMFSTVNFMINEKEYVNNTKMTSPDAFFLQKLLSDAKAQGCEYAIIETSSHSILMNRNWGINYDIAVLTNITQDHLDLHKTMEKYVQTKLRLFKWLITSRRKWLIKKTAIINYDSDYKDLFLAEAYDSVFTYGRDLKANIKIENYESSLNGTKIQVRIPWTTLTLETKLRGLFNVYNVLAAVWVFISLNYKPQEIESMVQQISWVPWRMEEVENNEWCKIYIDYAHTPDALEQVLTTLKEIQGRKRIITVFWATGDRDRTKRPEMGRIVSEYSDIVILTQDDDYSEKTESIIKDVLPWIERKEWENFWIIADRKEALRTALITAQKNDIILIAGKWDEHVLMTNNGPVEWHDKTIVKEILTQIENNTIIE
jgi:UDP-N-acetylmuramoyl-L-alanyl-D-glutamate--2,6-diaminopimelate ligase